MWNAEIARSFWRDEQRRREERARAIERERSNAMRYYVIDRESAKYFEKSDGSRVWHLSRADAMRVSNAALVVALDERNFNESLNVYYRERLFEQLHYDGRNGWIS